MKLGGLQKTTLIDFPGRVACTVFTIGCNFRCPFCHNKDLVTNKLFKQSNLKPLPEKEFFKFLEERKKILDGVAITGGEPTIHKDLPQFCKKIKDIGLQVKLDTNGSNPKMLKNLIDSKLIDFVSMDIKNTIDSNYLKTIGLDLNEKPGNTESAEETETRKKRNSGILKLVKQSIKIILQSGLEYEFRTTVVPTIHSKEALVNLAADLKKTIEQLNNGAIEQCNYYLQKFRPMNCLDESFKSLKPFTDKQMKQMLAAVQNVLPNAKIRGEDT